MSVIHQYFTADHQRLDCLYSAFKQLFNSQNAECINYFNKFHQDLIRHINWEEQVLFPFFEAKSGIKTGPTMIMCSEHKVIINYLTEIKQKLATDNVELFAELNDLESILAEHNQKEEKVLYPMIARFCQLEDSAKLFLLMNNEC